MGFWKFILKFLKSQRFPQGLGLEDTGLKLQEFVNHLNFPWMVEHKEQKFIQF